MSRPPGTPHGHLVAPGPGVAPASQTDSLAAQLREALDDRRRADADLQDIIEHAVEGLYAVDLDGVILWANRAVLTMLGYSRDEFVGRHIAAVHVDAPTIDDILRRLRQGETLSDVPARLRCQDGSIKHVLLNADRLSEDGRFVRAHCFVRDVTSLREAADATQRLSAIVEFSDDAIISKDLNGVVTSWNAGAERVFGYTAREMIGRSIRLIIPADRLPEEDEVLARVRRGEAVDHFETIRRRKDGGEVAISLTVSPIRDAFGTIVGASKVARDITDRKRSEAERERLLARAEQARNEAEQASRVKDEFLAILSHELRSPLNAISGWAQLAAGQLDRIENPVIRRALDVIERNVALQLRLVSDLLDVSSITNGKLPLRSDAVDVTATVGAVVDGIRPEAAAKGLHVQLQLDSMHLHVMGDAARLQQVVSNLLSNALKFTPPQGRVSVTLSRIDARVRIVVRDSGEGISPEFLPHVFGRFRQADASTVRRHGGLGIGLAVVQHLVRAHGGSITAESDGVGLGSVFTVDLPAAPSLDARPGNQLQPRARPLDGVRLLVVDDDMDTRDLIDAIFRLQNVGVTAVGSARDALDALRTQSFDILLSDLAMPEQDGYDLIEAVRHDPRPDIRAIGAIAVTAHADDSHRTRAVACGFDDFLTKPVDSDRLIRSIEGVLRRQSTAHPR